MSKKNKNIIERFLEFFSQFIYAFAFYVQEVKEKLFGGRKKTKIKRTGKETSTKKATPSSAQKTTQTSSPHSQKPKIRQVDIEDILGAIQEEQRQQEKMKSTSNIYEVHSQPKPKSQVTEISLEEIRKEREQERGILSEEYKKAEPAHKTEALKEKAEIENKRKESPKKEKPRNETAKTENPTMGWLKNQVKNIDKIRKKKEQERQLKKEEISTEKKSTQREQERIEEKEQKLQKPESEESIQTTKEDAEIFAEEFPVKKEKETQQLEELRKKQEEQLALLRQRREEQKQEKSQFEELRRKQQEQNRLQAEERKKKEQEQLEQKIRKQQELEEIKKKEQEKIELLKKEKEKADFELNQIKQGEEAQLELLKKKQQEKEELEGLRKEKEERERQERQKIEEELRRQEELRIAQEEAKRREEIRLEQEKAKEELRLAQEKAQEELRLVQEEIKRQQEELRLAKEKAKEELRLAQEEVERQQEELRLAQEEAKRQEELRLAKEKAKEELRLAQEEVERQQEELKLAQEEVKRQEELRLAKEKAQEELRLAQEEVERQQEELRLAQEEVKKQEERSLAQEKIKEKLSFAQEKAKEEPGFEKEQEELSFVQEETKEDSQKKGLSFLRTIKIGNSKKDRSSDLESKDIEIQKEKKRDFSWIRNGTLAAVLVIALIMGGSIFGKKLSSVFNENGDVQQEDGNSTTTKTEGSVTLSFVGDLMCHSPQFQDAYDVKTGEYNFSKCFSQVDQYLQEADLTIGNLETVFAGASQRYSGYPQFNTPDDFARTLKESGFDVLTTANNHSFDQGEAGVTRTLDVLDEVGISHVGTYRNNEEKQDIVIKEVNGIKFAFVSFAEYTNKEADNAQEHINYLTQDEVTSQIQLAKAQNVDCVIAMPHWGVEYETVPNDTQKKQAEMLLNAGADIIIGSHPHVIQKMGKKKVTGEDGITKEVFVAYSLGNFTSNQGSKYTRDEVILNLTVQKGANGIYLEKIGYRPVYMDKEGTELNAKNFQLIDIITFKKEFTQTGDEEAQNLYNTVVGAEEDIKLLLKGKAKADENANQIESSSSEIETTEAATGDTTTEDESSGQTTATGDTSTDSSGNSTQTTESDAGTSTDYSENSTQTTATGDGSSSENTTETSTVAESTTSTTTTASAGQTGN